MTWRVEKLESENPTGSMKDRMALAMIEAAEAGGRLPAGGPVVEYTGGSTGVSLAVGEFGAWLGDADDRFAAATPRSQPVSRSWRAGTASR